MANPNPTPSLTLPSPRIVPTTTAESQAAEQRVIYSCRVTIAGSEEDSRIAAVKVRAFLRRYLKPKGLTIRLSEEYERKERRGCA